MICKHGYLLSSCSLRLLVLGGVSLENAERKSTNKITLCSRNPDTKSYLEIAFFDQNANKKGLHKSHDLRNCITKTLDKLLMMCLK